ncbi:D-glycero-alpha-D-manno-heptose-1,7-bisphosphate 7-phosphatase [Sinomonas atrocyanea]|uniref:D-glycero-alpha-D-manno-heptose-1,7-bisphosphate 7-phosphatase n=1 Tax=Sinomonas atrocyanea TaxID=37927 RepID=UPI0027D7F38D|nr:HAD family hydrolase [Sinomonas atrocyanea]
MRKTNGERKQRPVPSAILFDRDGTLVADVPYNTDPDLVVPMPGALQTLGRLRALGIACGVVTNQSGVGLGLITERELRAVNDRIERILGPFDTWQVCPHAPEDRCECRKPKPGLVHAACRDLEVEPEDVVVIGDIGKDMEAARRAGARGILVPTPVTLRPEILAAPAVAGDLSSAVMLALGPEPVHSTGSGGEAPSLGSAA